MIPEETIAEVLAATDIVQFIGRYVELRKAGTLYKACCPFHSENTPSFVVYPVDGHYHCFGCQAHGHAIRFLMEHEARSFPEAVRELARAAGVTIPEPEVDPRLREARRRKRERSRRLLDTQDALTSYYSDALFGPTGSAARTYLQRRGVSPEAARAFRLGWADGDKLAFDRFARERGFEVADLVELGVVLTPDEGPQPGEPLDGGYLRFRRRLMFPVVDLRGDVTGYSARLITERKAAKYLNSPETPVFTKGHQLYGAHTARRAARLAGRVVLCEGNVDVVAMWQAGFEGTVAAMGTALTERQVRLVKRLSDNVVCVMDGDAAGEKAAFASLEPFLAEGIQPRAVLLPPGEDPDSLLKREGPEAMAARLESARPLLELFIDRVAGSHPPDPQGRAAALRALAPALQLLDDDLALQLYRDQVAQVLSVGREMVDRALASSPTVPPSAPASPPAPEPGPPLPEEPPSWLEVDAAPPHEAFMGPPVSEPVTMAPPRGRPARVPRYEREVVEFTIQFPEVFARMHDEELHECLTHPGLAAFVARLCQEVRERGSPNLDHLLDAEADAQVVAFIRRCQASRPSLPEERLEEAYRSSVRLLKRGFYLRSKRALESEFKAAFESDRARIPQIHARLREVKDRLRDLDTSIAEGAN